MKKMEMTRRHARTLLAVAAGLTMAGLSQAGEVEVLRTGGRRVAKPRPPPH